MNGGGKERRTTGGGRGESPAFFHLDRTQVPEKIFHKYEIRAELGIQRVESPF